MIRSVRIQNFKCVRDLTLPLGRLTALIGKNDTGKSSILQAIYLLPRFFRSSVDSLFGKDGFGRLVTFLPGTSPAMRFDVALDASTPGGAEPVDYSLSIQQLPGQLPRVTDEHLVHGGKTRTCSAQASAGFPNNATHHADWQRLVAGLSRTVCFQFDPRELSRLSTLHHDYRTPFLQFNGYGLASALEFIVKSDTESFVELKKEFRATTGIPEFRFANVEVPRDVLDESGRTVRIRQMATGLEFALPSGAIVRADEISDGVLYYLAFLCIVYGTSAPHLILLEEPENGVHPVRLREIVRLFRRGLDRFPETQILVTTHSPYLLDEMKPEEVWITRRGEERGTTVHQMSKMPGIEGLLGPFKVGELWYNLGEDRLAEGIPNA